MSNFNLLKTELNTLQSQGLLRENFTTQQAKFCNVNGKKLLNLISNDYLGIAANQELKKFFFSTNPAASLGATASRLLGGTSPKHQLLEEKLAAIFQKKALLFNSGYHANTGIIGALLGSKDVVFCDKLVHASIIDGIKLSGAKMLRYQHLDYEDLEKKLSKFRKQYQKALIITESIYSMDGDMADLVQLTNLKNSYDTLLMIDESHSFGIYGDQGYGLTLSNPQVDCDILIGTFGKALGSVGAFTITDELIHKLLISKSRSYIYSTALPPFNISWTLFVLSEILPTLQSARKHLQQLGQDLRALLQKNNLSTKGCSQIVPIMIGDIQKSITISKQLLANGFLVFPIRPPTVKSSRLRLSLNSQIALDELQPLVELLGKLL